MNLNLLPRISHRRLLLLLIPAAISLISACATNNPQDTFDTAGPVAEQQADLFKFIFWIAVVVFVLVETGIIWITLKYRRRSDSDMPKQTHGNTKLEVTWTIIPALIIVAIAIPTVYSIWDLAEAPEDEPAMVVEAIGHQWWFEFRYPEEELVTANELHVPVGKNVIVKLESQDVIHSFWVPKLFGKVDMVPTRENELWFRVDDMPEVPGEPDVYYGQCAEFCGIVHALMRFRVIAHPEDEYNDWVAGMRTAPDAPAAGSAADRGRVAFAANCSSCHSVDSYRVGAYEQEINIQEGRWDGWLANIEDARIVSAPNLTHFGTRTTLGAGIRDLDRDLLIDWIDDPSSIKEGTRMQKHAAVYQSSDNTANLTNSEVQDIADYLLSLKPSESGSDDTNTGTEPAGDPVEVGAAAFAANCTACHKTDSTAVVGPGLAGIGERAATRVDGLSADEYIRQSLLEPAAYIVPDFPAGMFPFTHLSDDEINGLIAYLKTLN
jgi:cytochrome c oxidase subunit 2